MAINISKVTINATTQKVWNTLTDPGQVKLWQYGSVLQTDWNAGSDITFTTEWEGQTFKQWGKVIELRLYELIQYSLFAPRPGLEDKPENYFTMSYYLTDYNGATKLEIVQSDNRPNAVQEPEQGEENPILKSLKAIAEGCDYPN